MSKSVRSVRLALALLGALCLSTSAMAAGFEKAQTWSAKAVSMGGAVVGSTTGAEALFFNPAGLSESVSVGEVSLNFSPTLSKFSGVTPYNSSGTIDGSTGFSPIGALVASFKPTTKLGLGAGYYVSGGTKSKYENVDYSGLDADYDTLKPTIETDLAIREAALGAGYEVMPGLRIGAAVRMISVKAKFSSATVIPATALFQINIDNIEATRYNAYKIGAQYEEPAHRWGLGINYRSSVKFIGKGDASASRELAAGGGTTDLGTGHAELDNTFPLQLALGGWTRATELVRIAYEYSFTNYSQNEVLAIRGRTTGVTAIPSVQQNWKNQHVIRLGGEYTGMGSLPLRAGYAFTSQVTPSDRVRATFASPGPGHSFTVGTGTIIGSGIDVDGALEYAFASGSGTNGTEVATESDFSSRAFAAHLSAKYHF